MSGEPVSKNTGGLLADCQALAIWARKKEKKNEIMLYNGQGYTLMCFMFNIINLLTVFTCQENSI